jgi:hypothetical protein
MFPVFHLRALRDDLAARRADRTFIVARAAPRGRDARRSRRQACTMDREDVTDADRIVTWTRYIAGIAGIASIEGGVAFITTSTPFSRRPRT